MRTRKVANADTLRGGFSLHILQSGTCANLKLKTISVRGTRLQHHRRLPAQAVFAFLLVLLSFLTTCTAKSKPIFLRGQIDPDVAHRLPANVTLPAHCYDFAPACKLEANDKFEEAFQYYESKYSDCGDWGWNTTGQGAGSRHVVVLKTTPCGLPVAIKRNTPKECNLLRALAAAASGKLFPAYYYYSNTTYACYSEHLGPHHTRWSDLIIVRPQLPPPVLWGLKTVFLQGVTAVHKMRSLGWEHHDMGFRNWALRNFPDSTGEPHWQFTVFDLGGAVPLKSTPAGYTRALGQNGLHTDMYMLANEFRAALLFTREAAEDPLSFVHALQVIADANNERQEPDYTEIARVIALAKH